MACTLIAVFFRDPECGHLTHGMVHSDICDAARQASDYRRQPELDCWNPYPPIEKCLYCVGKCPNCLAATEDRHRDTEPARQIYLGENPSIVNPGVNTPREIAHNALEWRWKVEQDERISRLEQMRRNAEVKMRRERRRIQWDNDWADYRASHVGEELPKILDLTEEIQGDDALLHPVAVQSSPAAPCPICHLPLDRPAYGESHANPRAMVCGHAMHRKCFAQALMHRRACPTCNAPAKFVLKASNDEPKLRWDEAEKWWHMVSGYITFQLGSVEGNIYEPYGNENRWGDED